MPKTLRASLLIGLAGCIYGAFLTITNIASNAGYYREDLLAPQFLFALVVFGVLVLTRYRHVKLKGKQRLRLMLIGVFGFGVSSCLFETVAATNSSFAVTMLYQCVWLGIAFDSLITKKLPPRPTIIAGVLVIIGMPLATGLIGSDGTINLSGVLWGFGAALSYVGMIWTSAHFETEVAPAVRTFYYSVSQVILASITCPQFYVSSIADPGAWGFAVPLSLSTAIIPVMLLMKNAPDIPVGMTTIMLGLEIPSTFVLEILVLRQGRGFLSVIGALLICAGIVVANKKGIAELRAQRKTKAKLQRE